MKLWCALCLFIAAAGVAACNLSPGYDLPSAGGKNDGSGDLDLGGDDDRSPEAACGDGGAGGAGGSCASSEDGETAESN